ncbi:MAG TPA: suppressor of fused domain protein [Trebonia sp.]|nr:suppressor of fused domain protein [Trebonia sp.]
MPFQVTRHLEGQVPDSVAFSTVGLSKFELTSRRTRKSIRHELIMCVPDSLRDGSVPGLLQQVGLTTLRSGNALLRGDVIGPAGPVLPGSSLTALYVGVPVYFPDEFAEVEEDGKTIIIAWLVPISDSEADYITEHGWRQFEHLLAEKDPDLVDVSRPSIC